MDDRAGRSPLTMTGELITHLAELITDLAALLAGPVLPAARGLLGCHLPEGGVTVPTGVAPVVF